MRPDGLAERLEGWMAEHRPSLDEMMREEGSRVLHLEFIQAEEGNLPDPETRRERAREASVRAWLRHLSHALEADTGQEGLAERMYRRFERERLEQLVLEERAATDRRGRAAPATDARTEQLGAWVRLFAEGAGEEIAPAVGGPELGRRVLGWWRANPGRVTEIAQAAETAWVPQGESQDGNPFGRVAADARVQEAAAVWAHVRGLCEALEASLVGAD